MEITLDDAIEVLSDEVNGCVTFNDKHNEAIKLALDLLIKVKTGNVVVKFGNDNKKPGV